MSFSDRPLWQVGFRPFFALACLAGALLPVLWALIFFGDLAPPPGSISATQWHAHEMFFGFGWAVLGGFLLTSTKNWVKIRGYHGAALVVLAGAWLVERVGMWFANVLPAALFRPANTFFLAMIVGMLLWSLIRHRRNDAFSDNYFFLIILPLFLVAKYLLLSADHFPVGVSIALGLFRVAFLVMLERTLGQFMKNTLQIDLPRNPWLDGAIKLLALLIVAVDLLPQTFAPWSVLLLALLLSARFAIWKPCQALRRIDIGIMYLGYLAIIAQLVLDFVERVGHAAWLGTVPIHVFTFGAMGLIIPAMFIRIVKGHTGRKVAFDTADKRVLWIMIAGLMTRTLLPQLAPAAYPYWITLAATCWLLCFTILAWRYIPYLWQARVDGRIH